MTKMKLLSLPSPRTKQEAQHLVGLFGLGKIHILPLAILLAPIYKTTQKKSIFEWGPEQQQAVSEL